ncbi:MAG: molybdopterin-guanine dinucleotide biosynthesis protein MobB [Gracilibacter sp. BRH_c7a]|nr:MAG: molybdopterin-guanine dinucleotide biosynthesis protein MobB [Gracilibacter sp. BRH_c7a]
MGNYNVPVVCVVSASSGTGKTTFLERLIKEVVDRGYRVGTIKSDAHGFEMDVPGKDTWKFSQAGAKATAIIGPDKFAVIHKTNQRKELDEVIAMIEDVDIILIEGYKTSTLPRFEVVRREKGTNIVSPSEYLIAVVTDVKEIDVPVPVLDINDIQGSADLLLANTISR